MIRFPTLPFFRVFLLGLIALTAVTGRAQQGRPYNFRELKEEWRKSDSAHEIQRNRVALTGRLKKAGFSTAERDGLTLATKALSATDVFALHKLINAISAGPALGPAAGPVAPTDAELVAARQMRELARTYLQLRMLRPTENFSPDYHQFQLSLGTFSLAEQRGADALEDLHNMITAVRAAEAKSNSAFTLQDAAGQIMGAYPTPSAAAARLASMPGADRFPALEVNKVETFRVVRHAAEDIGVRVWLLDSSAADFVRYTQDEVTGAPGRVYDYSLGDIYPRLLNADANVAPLTLETIGTAKSAESLRAFVHNLLAQVPLRVVRRGFRPYDANQFRIEITGRADLNAQAAAAAFLAEPEIAEPAPAAAAQP